MVAKWLARTVLLGVEVGGGTTEVTGGVEVGGDTKVTGGGG